MKTISLALVTLAIVAAPALAVSPSLRGMKPVGGRRGTEVVVSLTGQRLADVREILFYQTGIKATKVEAGKDGNSVTATFAIAPDARVGLHDFRVRTATGISPLKTFSVGVLKDVTEAEPNSDFARPQPIEMNVTVNGVADNEDIDYYAVKAKKGERITAEVEGIRLGLTLFDPYVAIMDAKRFVLASSDDAALIWQDGFASMIAPEDGTYIIAAREAAYAGNTQCLYRLHVGNFPRPTATIPAGGKLGETVSVRWIGDPLGEMTTTQALPAAFDRNFGLVAQDRLGIAPYPNVFRLSPFGNVVDAEPNDTHANATACTPPIALNGVIGTAGDVDNFTFKATKGQRYDVRVYARQIRSPLDSVLTIANKNGGNVARNDDTGGPDSYARFTAPKDGEFVVSIADHLKKGGPDYAYRVEIVPVEAKLTLTTPNESLRRGSGVQAVAVPRGNRQVLLINASRSDFGGELKLNAANLPAGVKVDVEAMPAGLATLPVLFTADAQAPVAATLATIQGRPVDTKLDVPCEFTSTAELVLGQNNVPFWTRTVESLAVAVTEEAPFTIEIVTPKVPLVRGGTMDLKVVAHRKPGFKAPIAVALPWNPPGTASKGGVVIPEGQDSALIPINANGGADLKTWKIVATGTYTEPPPATAQPQQGQRGRGGAGRLTIASDFADLTIAPPFLALKFSPTSVEQGKAVDFAVEVNKAIDFPGEAKMTLIGLPNKVTTDPVTITKDTPSVVFHIKTDPTSPAGEAKNLFCQVVVTQNGEPIVHNLGSGRLRIDAPLASKKPTAKPVATASAPRPDASAPARPLSRLEKLRLDAKERARASTEGATSSVERTGIASPPQP